MWKTWNSFLGPRGYRTHEFHSGSVTFLRLGRASWPCLSDLWLNFLFLQAYGSKLSRTYESRLRIKYLKKLQPRLQTYESECNCDLRSDTNGLSHARNRR